MSFIDNTNDSSNKDHTTCTCCLCEKILHETEPIIKTTRLCILILKSLKQLKPTNEYFSLKHDINGFITDHWTLLSKLRQFQNTNWRKSLLDAFNHCNQIESGKEVCHNRGYYRLREMKKEVKSEKKQKKQPKQQNEKSEKKKKQKKEEQMEIDKAIQEHVEEKIEMNDAIDLRTELFMYLQTLQMQIIENQNILMRYPYQILVDQNRTNMLPIESIVQNNLYHYQVLEQNKQFLCYLEMPQMDDTQKQVGMPMEK